MSAQALYRMFDSDGVLLYVGVTGRWSRRSSEHAETQPWWPLVTSVTIEHFASREEVIDAEARAIKLEQPAYNTAGNQISQHGDTCPNAYSHLTKHWNRIWYPVAKRRHNGIYIAADYYCTVCGNEWSVSWIDPAGARLVGIR